MANLFPTPERVPISGNALLSVEWVRWLRETINRLSRPFADLPVYANNAAAIAGGLKKGEAYRTGADPDLVCVVH